jgi:hypothetical protein
MGFGGIHRRDETARGPEGKKAEEKKKGNSASRLYGGLILAVTHR